MAQWVRNALFRRLYCTGARPSPAQRSKASRVIGVPRFEPDLTRTAAPTGFTIMDFLKTIGGGVEAHHDKLKTLCFSLRDVLVLKTEALKKLGLNVRDRKLVLRYAHRYRLGTWKPRKFKVVEQKQPDKTKK